MRHARPERLPWLSAGAAGLALAINVGAGAQTLKTTSLRIDSVPSAAGVELIGGRSGVTPLTISERDIYPNDYPDARADMYGMVLLRHPGCEPLRHRVTMADIKEGLHLRLDCTVSAAQLAVPPPLSPATASPTPSRSAIPPSRETASERRLRQLQVLQELLDEGLVSPAEEQRIRRRILQPRDKPGS